MTENNVLELRKKCVDVVASEIRKLDYDDLLYEFYDLAAQMKKLPVDNDAVRNTFRGIIGYKTFLEQTRCLDGGKFLDAAFNDLIECVNNYTETWYQPSTIGYMEYYQLINENQYETND